jgi:hypothetical protein
MSAFTVLRGERINGLLLGNDGWTLVVRTVGGKYFRFDTANDCCNSVWFNHVTGVNILGEGNSFDLIRGALVTEVETKDFERQDDEDGYEVIDDAFITIRTDRGYLDLEVRNSHNGYYGGSISYNDDPDLTSISDLSEITEDF